MTYQEATVEYYEHVDAHGDLRRADPMHEEFEGGTDEQRAAWVDHAPRQFALWTRLTYLNGEILRRIYAGKEAAILLMDKMREYVTEQVAYDGSLPDDGAETTENNDGQGAKSGTDGSKQTY